MDEGSPDMRGEVTAFLDEDRPAADRAGDAGQPHRPVPAVVHAVRILRCLSRMDEPAGVTAIARGAGISPSTCFNILRTLVGEGLVSFNAFTKSYDLGPGLVELGAKLLGLRHMDVVRAEMAPVAIDHGVLIAVWQVTTEERIVLIDRVFPASQMHVEMRIGQRRPAFSGAVGRCVAAALRLSADDLKRRYDEVRWQNAPGFDVFLADTARAGIDGYATDNGNLFRGIHNVGAVVADETGEPRLAFTGVSIAGTLSEEEIQQLGRDMAAAGHRIRRILYGVD